MSEPNFIPSESILTLSCKPSTATTPLPPGAAELHPNTNLPSIRLIKPLLYAGYLAFHPATPPVL